MQLFTPKQHLEMNIVNMHIERLSFNERLETFNNNKAAYLSFDASVIKEAAEPNQLIASINAYKDAMNGKAIGFGIAADATASGAQLYAVLSHDNAVARDCNLTSSENYKDFYSEATLAFKTQKSRKEVKQAVMPWFYGSAAKPAQVFGSLEAFEDAMAMAYPGMLRLRQALLKAWNKNNVIQSWTLPDGFQTSSYEQSSETWKVKLGNAYAEIRKHIPAKAESSIKNAANVIHSIDGYVAREAVRRARYGSSNKIQLLQSLRSKNVNIENITMFEKYWALYKKTGMLSAGILPFCDGINPTEHQYDVLRELILSLPNTPFEVLVVHDSFRVLPTYANEIRCLYNKVLYEIAESNLMDSILTDIHGKTTTFEKESFFNFRELGAANHSLS